MLARPLQDAPDRGQPEQRGGPAAHRPAPRPGARGGGPRDGHVRRRRDPRPGGDRPAVHRDRHRGPARPPVPDRLASRRSRTRRRSSSRRCRRPPTAAWRSSTPTTRGCARMAARTRARVVTYGFAPDADVTADGDRDRRLRRACASGCGRPAGEREAAIPALGRLAVHNALAATAAGLAAGMTLDEILPGLAAASTGPAPRRRSRAGGVTIVDDAYNASPGLDARGPRAPRRAARPPRRRAGRDAGAGRRPRGGPPRGRRAAAGRWTCWSSWTAGRAGPRPGSPTGRGPPAWPRTGSLVARDAPDAVEAAPGRDARRATWSWSRPPAAWSSSGSWTASAAAPADAEPSS